MDGSTLLGWGDILGMNGPPGFDGQGGGRFDLVWTKRGQLLLCRPNWFLFDRVCCLVKTHKSLEFNEWLLKLYHIVASLMSENYAWLESELASDWMRFDISLPLARWIIQASDRPSLTLDRVWLLFSSDFKCGLTTWNKWWVWHINHKFGLSCTGKGASAWQAGFIQVCAQVPGAWSF